MSVMLTQLAIVALIFYSKLHVWQQVTDVSLVIFETGREAVAHNHPSMFSKMNSLEHFPSVAPCILKLHYNWQHV